jgi:hypothetical protein
MADRNGSTQGADGGGRQSPVQLTSFALRSLGQVYDMNVSAARVLLQTQARAASMLGLPDWSAWFDSADERARGIFAASAEQLVNATRRTTEAVSEMNREASRLIDSQTATVAQTVQFGLKELDSHTSEGLTQLVDTAREQADEAERVASELGEQVRQTIEVASEQARRRRGETLRAVEEAAENGESEESEGNGSRARRRKSA